MDENLTTSSSLISREESSQSCAVQHADAQFWTLVNKYKSKTLSLDERREVLRLGRVWVQHFKMLGDRDMMRKVQDIREHVAQGRKLRNAVKSEDGTFK